MPHDWEHPLTRWTAAGLLDPATADSIRAWEAGLARPDGLRFQTRIILALGSIMLAAGLLLFVSAHWDQLSPAWRMTLVVSMVGILHAGGAAAHRFEALSVALHAIGTVTLGAAIALAGQIFNLAEHWPTSLLMWAAGAALGWFLLQQWPQAALTALLLPAWLAGEWSVYAAGHNVHYFAPVTAGICALSLTYLSARGSHPDTPLRRALQWLGGIAVLPAAAIAALLGAESNFNSAPDAAALWIGWITALALPLAVAVWLRREHAVWNAGATFWSAILPLAASADREHLLVYAWCAAGSIGLAAWGIVESRAERINLAIAGFALTVLFFYFSNVMDKMGRSASLMLLGTLFLGGGWALERTRRGLLARMRPEAI